MTRPTIGLVTANIHLGVGATLWSGVLDAAQRHDVNLICFPGGEVHATDRPRNSVYDLVAPGLLDGLICWASTLGLPVAHARAARLARRFGRLPMVSLNGALGDDRPLMLDSYRGMSTAISHLIETHERHRLAFIRGAVANPVTGERYRAYTDTLARYRIPLDRTLVSSPVDFRHEAGASAMRVLLDARALRPGRDFDAVVASSDFLAADAMRLLAERGIRVPEDVAVIGVNDSPEARLADPPLTSVSMPFAELGELAVDTLLSRLDGSSVRDRPAPASTLVVRRSCGCPGTPVIRADAPPDPDRLPALLREELQTSRHLRELGNALSSVVDPSALAGVLDRQLPALGIPHWHLSLEPSSTLPDGVLPRERRYSMVAEPLYVRDELLGVGMFEVGPRDGAVYRALGDQLGAALKEIKLFGEVMAARDAAEKANRVKTTLLSSVSDELRAPVEGILRQVAQALRAVEAHGQAPPGLVDSLKEINVSAEHQLGVICDLLDLSRAEIDTLDLSAELIDPRALLEEVFRTRLPDRLPLIQADRRRLRQALVTLHGCAERLTAGTGRVEVRAEVRPPHLRIVITCVGGLPPGEVTGTGLGLPITRRMITLHNGSLHVESGPDGGGFHVALPLPAPDGQPVARRDANRVLLVGGAAEATEAGQLGLPVRRLRAGDDIPSILEDATPAAVVWDLTDTRAEDWSVISHLHDHALLRRTPFLVYGSGRGRDLAEVIAARRPAEAAGPMVIADPDQDARARYQRLVAQVRPGHVVLAAPDGSTALAMLGQDVPSVLVLAKALPDMDAFDVLERLRGEARLPDVPAVVLSDTTVSADDVRRAEPHGRAALIGSSILSEMELVELVSRLLTPAHRSSPMVRHAVAFLHQHYHHPITRRQVAKAAGMSEDYLSRMFHRELGVSPWDYLNRLRIQRAKERLRESDDSIQLVARRVGFHDRAYFSRIFRKLTGVPPQVYRDSG